MKKINLLLRFVILKLQCGGGERYNHDSNDEYRRSYDNLILLCYPHHIETNDVDEYSTPILKRIKSEHEKMFEKTNFKIDEAELYKLSSEMEKYWSNIEKLNKFDHIFADSGLVMEVEGQATFFDVIESAYNSVDGIESLLSLLHESDEKLQQDFELILTNKSIPKELFESIPYSENPFFNRNWELHNIGKPNWIQRLQIDLAHIEVKYLEEYLKTNRNDFFAKARFENVKKRLEEYAQTVIYVD